MSRRAALFARAPVAYPRKMTAPLHWIPLRDLTDLCALGSFVTNLPVGGSSEDGIPATATGDVVLLDYNPWLIPNANSQLTNFDNSNGGSLVCRVRFKVRVSDAAISVTPKLWYGSAMDDITTAASIAGETACSAAETDYTGDDQFQAVTFTAPAGNNYFKAGLTIGGTTGPTLQVWGQAWFDLFISS